MINKIRKYFLKKKQDKENIRKFMQVIAVNKSIFWRGSNDNK